MAVQEDISIHQRRQILLIVDVAMAHIEGMASLDQDAVICQHRELQYHLIYFCVAVSAHVGEVLFFSFSMAMTCFGAYSFGRSFLGP